MKVKQAIEFLSKYDGERELVLFEYKKRKTGISEGRFYSLSEGMTPEANSKNLLVMIAGFRLEPVR